MYSVDLSSPSSLGYWGTSTPLHCTGVPSSCHFFLVRSFPVMSLKAMLSQSRFRPDNGLRRSCELWIQTTKRRRLSATAAQPRLKPQLTAETQVTTHGHWPSGSTQSRTVTRLRVIYRSGVWNVGSVDFIIIVKRERTFDWLVKACGNVVGLWVDVDRCLRRLKIVTCWNFDRILSRRLRVYCGYFLYCELCTGTAIDSESCLLLADSESSKCHQPTWMLVIRVLWAGWASPDVVLWAGCWLLMPSALCIL